MEVAKRTEAFIRDLQPKDSIDLVLVSRAAVMSLRMERAAEREISTNKDLTDRCGGEAAAPGGIAFDMSKQAEAARRYEAAAERSFYKALRELRIRQKEHQAEAKAVEQTESVDTTKTELASISTGSGTEVRVSPSVLDEVLAEAPQPERNIATLLQVNQSGTEILPIMVGRFR